MGTLLKYNIFLSFWYFLSSSCNKTYFLGLFSILPIAYCSPFGNFLRKFFQSNQQKFSKKQQKQKQKRKSKKWQNLSKQVNPLFETIPSIPPSTTLYFVTKKTTTER